MKRLLFIALASAGALSFIALAVWLQWWKCSMLFPEHIAACMLLVR